MATKTPFQTFISEPLEALLGEKLQHVNYRILTYEAPHFNLDAPNQTGPVTVRLEFMNHTLEVYAAPEKTLLDGTYYCILAGLIPAELLVPENFCLVNADASIQWSEAISQTLEVVEVTGIRSSPQAIRFVFATKTVFLSSGYSGEGTVNDPAIVGDGIEMLVFGDEEFFMAKRTLPDPWAEIWGSVRSN